MLQFRTGHSDRYTIAEEAQMAIEGGCRWIQLHMPADADIAYIRDTTSEIIPLCQECSAFLTIEDNPDLAKELSIHGVHLTKGGIPVAAATRQELGPEAIIGVEVATLAEIDSAQAADIDYVTLPPDMPLARCHKLISDSRQHGLKIPIVAAGDVTLSNLRQHLDAGFSGVAVGQDIIDASDPVERTTAFLLALERGQI